VPAALVPARNAAAPAPVDTPRTVWTSRLVAVLAAVIAAALVVAVRDAGWLSGVPGLAAAAALSLAFPTSRLLARRILIAGAFAFGAAPLLWFWDLPVGDTGRVTVLMAVGVGALSAWVLWSGRGRVRGRAQRLVPRLHRIDLLPGVAAIGAGVATLPWLRVRTGPEALSALLSGWDNSAHYDIVAMIRRFGITTDRLTDIPPEHWKFTDYPGGYLLRRGCDGDDGVDDGRRSGAGADRIRARRGLGPGDRRDPADRRHRRAAMGAASSARGRAGRRRRRGGLRRRSRW